MRVIVAYRSETEYEREVTSWLREFEHRTGRELERIDPDSREGATFCKVHDLVEYPTIMAIDDGGKMQNMWRGVPLPLIDEVSYYVQ